MLEKIIGGVFVVLVYPFLLVFRAIIWCAGKMRIDPFYLTAALVVAPLWVGMLAENTVWKGPGESTSVGDIAMLILGAVFLVYVMLMAALGLLTRSDGSDDKDAGTETEQESPKDE